MFFSTRVAVLFLLGALVASAPARAASERTFVASYGADSNSCSVAAPCRTFAAALGLTAAGGEVVALDSAGYGLVTITQSVSISAPAGIYAGITAPILNGSGVLIDAPGATVVLRGLTIASSAVTFGTGLTVQAAAQVTVQRCTFEGGLLNGIRTFTSTSAQTAPLTISVSDSDFVGSAATEILLGSPPTGAAVTANIHNVRMIGTDPHGMPGIEAIALSDGVNATIDSSRISGYSTSIVLQSIGMPSFAGKVSINVTAWNNELTGGYVGVDAVTLATSMIVANLRGNVISGTSSAFPSHGSPSPSSAIYAGGMVSVVLDGNTISGNSVGVTNKASSATIQSYGNNQFEGNATDFVGTVTPATPQ